MIPHNRPTLGADEELAAQRVLRSGWVAQGPEVEAFENELCASVGLPEGRAVAVSSGTAALFLALEVLGARGKDVSFPVYACSALRNAVAMSGAKENLLDCAPGSPNADPKSVKTPFAILPHMFGIPGDVAAAKSAVIEDCAQALGLKKLAGKVSIFSFYATKLITSGGQGGMLVSKDASVVEAARDYRQFDGRKDHRRRFNLQMTDLQAAIGRAQLKRLPEFLKRREEIFSRYKKAGLDLLDGKGAVRYRAVLKTNKPAKVLAALHAAEIKAIVPVEDWELLGEPKSFPNAAALSRSTVSLPCYPSLSNEDVDCVIAALRHA